MRFASLLPGKADSSFVRIVRVSLLLVVASLLVLSDSPMTGARAAEVKATVLPSAGKPLAHLMNPEALGVKYTGAPEAVAALKSGRANPTALASGDFNADGAMDLVAGYATAEGGVLTVLRGNPDAFAPKDSSLFMKAMNGKIAPTFLPGAEAYSLPERPDLILVADFNHDGTRDVLVAARGGKLYMLAGDGTGKLGLPELVTVGGPVRAMATSGDGHVALSIDGEHGPELVILAPAAEGPVHETAYPLPARGDAVLWGNLGGGADVAVGSGSHILIVYNVLERNPKTETVDVPFKVEGLTAGNFIWNRDGLAGLAALADDGSVHILQHGTLDVRPLTPADIPGRRAALKEKRKQQRVDPTSIGTWTVAKKLPYSGSPVSGPVAASAFFSPHLAASSTADLVILDGKRGQLNLLDTSGKTESRSLDVSFSSAPVAALTLPQKINARRDTVILTAGEAQPMIMNGGGDPTFNVSTTADIDTVNACSATSSVTSGGSPLSLREAICEANNNGPGTYTINVPAGTYSLAISTFGGGGSAMSGGELQVGMSGSATFTISGAGQGSTIIQQTNGVDRVIEQDELGSGDMPLTIQNLTLQYGSCTTGLDCGFSGGALLAGYYPGDALTLTSVTVSNSSEQADTPALGGGNQGGGVSMAGPDFIITNSTFSGNSVTASSSDSGYGGGVEFLDDTPGSLTVTGSTFTNNSVAASNNGAPGGGLYIDLNVIGDTASVSGSIFTGNTAGGSNGVGGGIYSSGLTTVTNSRITGNTAAGGGSGFWEQGYAGNAADGVGTVKNNWWGCNGGPGQSGCDTVEASGVSGDDASVVSSPWLELQSPLSASSTSISLNGTSSLTADLTHNSNGTGGFTVPNGTPISFSGGSFGSANPNSSTLSSGTATSTFTGTNVGTGTASATVDNQTVSVTIDISGTPTLGISKSHPGTFTQGSTAEWDITVANTASDPSNDPTSGAVTVVDALPSGYTLSSSTGSGWNCSGLTIVTCTSAAVVEGGSSFPVIKLTVNVPSTSPTSVTNTAEAYGGGDPVHTSGNPVSASNTVNNVVQVPALIVLTGNNQSATVGTGFGSPLSVEVEDAAGNPISGQTVTFTAPGSGASGKFSNTSTTITATTNSGGIVSEPFTANNNAGSYSVTVADGSISNSFNLTNTAGAASSLSFPGSAEPANTAFSFTVTALDVFGNVATSYNGTVAFNSSDPQFVNPGLLTLTNGVGTEGGFALKTAGTQSITANDTSNPSIMGSSFFAVQPGPAASFTVNAPSSAYAGAPFNFTVTAYDLYGNIATGYRGTVHFTTTDTGAGVTLPVDYTFVALDNGVHAFKSGGTLVTPPSQSITATDTTTPTLNGTSSGINITIPNYVVTQVLDDAGDGTLCTIQTTPGTGNDGSCSLRDALLAAGTLGSGSITFDGTAFAAAQSIMLTNGTLNIPSNTSINGPTTGKGTSSANLVTVNGNAGSSVFTVGSGVTGAAFANLIVTNGPTPGFGSCVSNNGALTISTSTISGNSANGTFGGGISNTGTLTLTASTVSGNSAIAGEGGGIYNSGTLTVTNSTIAGNTAAAGLGGGIVNDGGTVTLTDSTISGNSASSGGGINNLSGTVNLANSIVSGNTGDADIDGSYTDNGGNQVGGTANLAVLANYGGPTNTMLPLPGSTAICGGLAANIPVGVIVDQRFDLNTNTSYPGYSPGTPCVDSGAVQSNYALGFSTSPASPVTAGAAISPAPVVGLTESGVAAATASGSVSVTDADTTLGGTLSASLSSGSATFSNLVFPITTSLSGDVLNAAFALTSSISLPAQSTSFNVNATPAAVSLTHTNLPFGSINYGSSSNSATVTLTNTGGSTLSISSIAVTGPGASSFIFSNNCGPTIASGGTCTIHGHFAPQTSGPLSAAVTITDNAGSSPQSINLTGTGVAVPIASLSNGSLGFGSQSGGTSSLSKSVILTNTGDLPLNINSITVTGTGASSFIFDNSCGSSLGVGANCTIHGHFSPQAVGPLTAAVTISDNAGNTPQSISLSGTGVGAAAVQLSTTNVNYGSVNVGLWSWLEYLTMTNVGNIPLEINSITVTGTNASSFVFENTCGSSLAVGANCTIHGHFQPTGPGPVTAAVSISDNAGNTPQTISLSGTGVSAATAILSGYNFNFGTQTVGTSSNPEYITLTNAGNQTLFISSITAGGSNPSSFVFSNNCGASLTAGASCLIHGHFKPTTTGPLSATITITDNDVNPTQTITYTGTGQ